MTKLYLGSGRKKLEGFTNVDALEWEGNTDLVMDITQTPWEMKAESIRQIFSEEFFEHISFRHTHKVLKECYRVLEYRGVIKIQVPDIGLMMDYWKGSLICDCVPRKADSFQKYKANPDCFKCGGFAKVHPERWLFAFTGAQKHPYDAHLNIFTKDIMKGYLEKVGFDLIEFEPNIYKIIIQARKV